MPPTPPTPPAGGAAPQPTGPLTPEQDKNYAGLSHLLGGAVAALAAVFALFSLIPSSGWGITLWTGPSNFCFILLILAAVPSVIFYFVYKDRGAWTAQESKEALNFQIWVAMASVVLWIVASIIYNAVATSIFTGGYGGFNVVSIVVSLAVAALAALNAWFSWNGYNAVKGNSAYRYPILPVRFIK